MYTIVLRDDVYNVKYVVVSLKYYAAMVKNYISKSGTYRFMAARLVDL